MSIGLKDIFSRTLAVGFYAIVIAATAFSMQMMVDDISKRNMEQLKFDTAFFGVEATFVIVITYMVVGDYVVVIKRRAITRTEAVTTTAN